MILDPWHNLRSHTSARIALGRSGGSLPTSEVLNFAMDHAAAQDAVQEDLAIEALPIPAIIVHSRAPDRETYLHRPDLGRRLDDASRAKLQPADVDLAIIIADGLSSRAVTSHAPALVAALLPTLRSKGVTLAPLVIALQARVAIQDEIGELLRCKASLILLGERPGLGSPDSLGAYLVFNPQPGNTDSHRNCVSNIRPQGLPIPAAAKLLEYLITESLRRKISGVNLKDEHGFALSADNPKPKLSGK